MKRDYKETLDFMNEEVDGIRRTSTEEGAYHVFKYNGDTIRHALAMMQKLEEPSTDMNFAAFEAEEIDFSEMRNGAAIDREINRMFPRILKAMLEQAEKEISG